MDVWDTIDGMDREELRLAVRALVRRHGCDEILGIVAVMRGESPVDAAEVSGEAASVIAEATVDALSDEYGDSDDALNEIFLEGLRGRFGTRLEDAADAGRDGDALAICSGIVDALRDPDVPWKNTPAEIMASRETLASHMESRMGAGDFAGVFDLPDPGCRSRPRLRSGCRSRS